MRIIIYFFIVVQPSTFQKKGSKFRLGTRELFTLMLNGW